MRKIIFLHIIFTLLTIFRGHSHASVTISFSDYFPLNIGNSWLLKDEFGQSYCYQVISAKIPDGAECNIVNEVIYQYTNFEGNIGYASLSIENGALKIIGFDGAILDSPRIYTGQDIDNDSVHIVFQEEPEVTTPAGVFNDVVKMTIYTKQYVGKEIITKVQYYAKGIGLIKDEDWCASCGGIYDRTALLESYKINTAGYTQEELDKAVLEERKKYDPSGDGIVSLEEAIHSLRTVSGMTK